MLNVLGQINLQYNTIQYNMLKKQMIFFLPNTIHCICPSIRRFLQWQWWQKSKVWKDWKDEKMRRWCLVSKNSFIWFSFFIAADNWSDLFLSVLDLFPTLDKAVKQMEKKVLLYIVLFGNMYLMFYIISLK